MKHVTNAGIGWQVIRTWPQGNRDDERRLKKMGSPRYCPICNPKHWYARGNITNGGVDNGNTECTIQRRSPPRQWEYN